LNGEGSKESRPGAAVWTQEASLGAPCGIEQLRMVPMPSVSPASLLHSPALPLPVQPHRPMMHYHAGIQELAQSIL